MTNDCWHLTWCKWRGLQPLSHWKGSTTAFSSQLFLCGTLVKYWQIFSSGDEGKLKIWLFMWQMHFKCGITFLFLALYRLNRMFLQVTSIQQTQVLNLWVKIIHNKIFFFLRFHSSNNLPIKLELIMIFL